MKTLNECKDLLEDFKEAKQSNDRSDMALAYTRLASASNRLPPCNVVNSLHVDIDDYRLDNLKADLETIRDALY